MTGIGDLQTAFGGTSMGCDGVSTATKGAESAIGSTAGNQSLTEADKSSVSSTGDAMLQAMGTSDVRLDKVASLQAAITAGSYSVSSEDVAGKLIDSMLGKG